MDVSVHNHIAEETFGMQPGLPLKETCENLSVNNKMMAIRKSEYLKYANKNRMADHLKDIPSTS